MIQTDWTAMPTVFSQAGLASTSDSASHANPIRTIRRPRRFSGRLCQDASPQPSSDRPTSSSSTGPGSVGRPGGWWAASHTAPATAGTARAATNDSLAFITADSGGNRSRVPGHVGALSITR
jgi:hypothetical protein